MANQVTDNRTGVATGEVADPGGSGLWENLGGTVAVLDTEVSYDTYTGSIGDYCTTTRDGTFWNAEATGLFASGDHAYLLVNCGIVSLLDTKALGGLTVRVTGATSTDWAEFELFGSDEWPTAFDGGWIQIVVDIDELLANPTNVNGTPPTVGNIQRFGITFVTATVMPRMADNIWVGGFAILPASTPAIIVEGRNGGSTDWNLASVAAVAAVQLSAVLKPGTGGSFVCRGPIQYGINDTSTHAFLETNKTLLWDDQEVMLDGFYGLSALGNSGGSTSVTFGIKAGTGDAATGAQGGSVQAAALFSRWNMDFNDPDLDTVAFYGATLQHGGDFLLNDVAVSCIGTIYLDCTSADIRLSEQLRCKVVDPNVTAGVAFFTADEMDNIVFCEFESSGAGHAIELTTPIDVSQISKGNLFSAYDTADPGTANNKAVYNNQAGAIVISNTSGGNLTEDFHVRNGASASTDVQANISTTLTGMKDNTEVRVYDQSNPPVELAGIENATAGTVDDRSFTFALSATTLVDIVVFNIDWILPPNNRVKDFTVPSVDSSIPISQVFDRNYENPP